MTTTMPSKAEIHQLIDQLPPDQLARVGELLQRLLREPTAPIYRIHEQAVATGVTDLAEEHDHYLYGEERDA